MYKFHHTLAPLLSDTTRLFLAAKEGDVSLVETLLNMDRGMLYRTHKGQTLLYIAAQYGHEQLVQLLLDRGLSADILDEDGVSPLYMAVRFKYKTIITRLITATADHEQLLVDAFHCAIEMDDIDILELLFRHNKRLINYHNQQNGYTALHVAVRHHHIHSMRWLLARGADVMSKGMSAGEVVFALAVQYSRVGCSNDLVEALLAAGADPNMADDHGNTAGYYAARNGNVNLMTYLIDHGLNIHDTNHEGQTILYSAANLGHDAMVQLLLNMQITHLMVNQADVIGNTPLHAAARNGHLRTVYLLLMHGANPSQLSRYQDAALHLAVRYNRIEVVRTLLEHSVVHLNTRGCFNMVPLQESVLGSTCEITALLLLAYASSQTNFEMSLMYTSVLNKWMTKILIKKSLTSMVHNQIIRTNISRELKSFFGDELSTGQRLAVELWWRMQSYYRILFLIIANTSPQAEKSTQPISLGHLPLEVRQNIAYYIFKEALPFHCLEAQSLIHGIGFLLEWLATHNARLRHNTPQQMARCLSFFGCNVFNPWIAQERKMMNQRAAQIATHMMENYLGP